MIVKSSTKGFETRSEARFSDCALSQSPFSIFLQCSCKIATFLLDLPLAFFYSPYFNT